MLAVRAGSMLLLFVTLERCLWGFMVWLLSVSLSLAQPVVELLLLLQREGVVSNRTLRATGGLFRAHRCMAPAHRQRTLLCATVRQNEATNGCSCGVCRQEDCCVLRQVFGDNDGGLCWRYGDGCMAPACKVHVVPCLCLKVRKAQTISRRCWGHYCGSCRQD